MNIPLTLAVHDLCIFACIALVYSISPAYYSSAELGMWHGLLQALSCSTHSYIGRVHSCKLPCWNVCVTSQSSSAVPSVLLMHSIGPMLFRICLLYESCSKHDPIPFVIDYDRLQAEGLNTASERDRTLHLCFPGCMKS